MKILGIDYGTKNIGLALSDEEQKIAFPHIALNVGTRRGAFMSNTAKIISEMKNICEKERVEKIIVGLPINLSGEKTAATQAVLDFIEELKKFLSIPVETIDERLSTEQAKKLSANKENTDAISAQILLQGWLERIRNKE